MAAEPAEDSGSESDACEYSHDELISSNPFTLRSFSKRKIQYMALFDVENWASELKDFTFPTEVTNVAICEGVAIKHFYQEGICQQRNKITADDELSLASLVGKIDLLISQLRARNAGKPGVFVRLGPRSPKDAPMIAMRPPADMAAARASLFCFSESKVRAALEHAAQRLMQEGHVETHGSTKTDACEVMRRFQDVCYGLLRVTSAEEALGLLLNSSRVMQDICHTLDTLDKGATEWKMTIVVREFDDEVRLEREFRTFVVAGEVTAISQYDDQLMYTFAATHKEKIVAAIKQCLAIAKPILQALSANLGVVADFLVVPSMDHEAPWHARIIELNPFGPMTGASLFTWTGDRRLLQGGLDLYGDLAECELQTPAGSIAMLPHVDEKIVLDVPFRYLTRNPPGFTRDHLHAYWEDYVRLAPTVLLQGHT